MTNYYSTDTCHVHDSVHNQVSSVLERLASSTPRKLRGSVVSDPIQWLLARSFWLTKFSTLIVTEYSIFLKFTLISTNVLVVDGVLIYHTMDVTLSVLLKGKGSPYSITERRVPELIPVLGSQPAGEVSNIHDGRLPLLFATPAVFLATLKRVATNRWLGEQRHDGCEQFA